MPLPVSNSPGRPLLTACAVQNSPSTPRPTAFPRKNSPSTPENSVFRPFWACRANFFALAPTPGRAGRNSSRAGRRNMETMKPTTPLLALNKATETGITSAPENCTKIAHFSPAKAMAVSIPHRHKRAKAITVSAHRTTSPAAPTRRPWAGQAAAPVGGDDTAARHISHVIYRGHCSRRSRNGLFRVDCG